MVAMRGQRGPRGGRPLRAAGVPVRDVGVGKGDHGGGVLAAAIRPLRRWRLPVQSVHSQRHLGAVVALAALATDIGGDVLEQHHVIAPPVLRRHRLPCRLATTNEAVGHLSLVHSGPLSAIARPRITPVRHRRLVHRHDHQVGGPTVPDQSVRGTATSGVPKQRRRWPTARVGMLLQEVLPL